MAATRLSWVLVMVSSGGWWDVLSTTCHGRARALRRVERIDHELRRMGDVVPELRVLLRRQRDLVQRRAEVAEPVLLRLRRDGIGRVAHPEPRVAAALRVRRRPAPVLHQEQPEALLGGSEVVLGGDRPQVVVLGHAPVEGGDDPGDRLLAADLGVERGGHAVILGHESPAPSAPSASSTATVASGSPGVRFITYDVGYGAWMPSWSKRSLIRARSTRATRHCSMGAVLSATRSVIASEVIASMPQISGSSMITPS